MSIPDLLQGTVIEKHTDGTFDVLIPGRNYPLSNVRPETPSDYRIGQTVIVTFNPRPVMRPHP